MLARHQPHLILELSFLLIEPAGRGDGRCYEIEMKSYCVHWYKEEVLCIFHCVTKGTFETFVGSSLMESQAWLLQPGAGFRLRLAGLRVLATRVCIDSNNVH